MKWLLVAMVMFTSSVFAAQPNMQIGFPVEAARLGLTGEIEFKLDCDARTVEIIKSSNTIFERHVRRNIHVMCYRNKERHNIKTTYYKGGSDTDMIARQPSRFLKDEVNVE